MYLGPDLHPKGKEIIECCLSGGHLLDFEKLAEDW
jgi:hypothetical protein